MARNNERAETLEQLKKIRSRIRDYAAEAYQGWWGVDVDALDVAIAALEREPGLIEEIERKAKEIRWRAKERHGEEDKRIEVDSENARLQFRLSEANQDAGRWQSRAEGYQAQITRLRAALEKRDRGIGTFPKHDRSCDARISNRPCDCGHDEARRALEETAEEGECRDDPD